ncbi:transposon Ty3-I Gag-Pol polyprotein [Trichonephila clavata]|uniref:RNA-directed DNA polymerase n=1 Tax=Trichonephila clavata TaxID=2740835 RepID=A0A8X6LVU5_TRICU|nr:transposon Ty3-I Gag-Pol polyprotein [Trichonephila clavata]
MVDASDSAIGSVLHTTTSNGQQPLAFYSRKLTPAGCKYSTQLSSVLPASPRYTGLILLHNSAPISSTYRAQKRCSCDTLSRINEVHLPKIDFSAMAEAQASDEELQAILGKNELSLFLKPLSTDPDSSKLYCDVKQNKIKPYIPEIFRKKVFLALHNISHPGVRATKRLISERFFSPSMQKDISNFTRSCLHCQKSKVARHTYSPLQYFQLPSARFDHVPLDLLWRLVHMCSCTMMLLKNHYRLHMMDLTSYSNELKKMFTIEKNGKQSTINIDRLKPAFYENSHHSSAPTISSPPVAVPTSAKPVPDSSPSSPVSPTNSTPLPYVTRSGRRVRFNSRYL